MTDYIEFLQSKIKTATPAGFDVDESTLNPRLFPFQRAVVRWALKLGKAALFEERGLGKTIQELEWAAQVSNHTGGKVIILTPLAVAHQHIREANKFGYTATYCQDADAIGDNNIIVTNYERLDKFDPTAFAGVVLDESSILKAYTGKTKQSIINAFIDTPYKLAASATPAPNDHLELGNHADFLNIMPSNEMISRWFINDTMAAGSYRLKNHAAADFWKWLTSWAVCLSHPRDIGDEYDVAGYDLPELQITEHVLSAAQESIDRAWAEGRLMPDTSPTATTLHKVKRESLADRIEKTRELVDALTPDEPVIIWCHTNYEADALVDAFPDALEVRGSHSIKIKEERLEAFTNGDNRMIITKPSIAGFGLNWQHCNRMIFAGMNFSFEEIYQAIGRSHRFGQTNIVNVDLIYAETEGNVLQTIQRKQEQFEEMQSQMNNAMKAHGLFRDGKKLTLTKPETDDVHGKNWTMMLGDCVARIADIDDDSIGFGIHSPPFANLYIYSDSEADMGNALDDDEFFDHYEYLIKELYRTTMPGRLCAVHCKDLPAYMNRDGAAGLKDFPGEIIRRFEKHGWQYHSRVTIWKDPVIEMQRTKNHGLLHKNFTERSEACRQGMPDYLVVFRKWPIDGGAEIKQTREEGDYIGSNPPTENDLSGRGSRQRNYSIALWQRYASPVWFDIDQTNVLNYRMAKANQDEKHICPLQLDVIARSIDLWSAPGDTVLSPFAGIGSEGYEALKLKRKFIGIELKRSYFDYAVEHLREVETQMNQPTLWDLLPEAN